MICNFEHKVFITNNLGGITAGDNSVSMFLRREISETGPIEAILLEVLFAIFAFPAGIYEASHSYRISYFKF